MAATLSVTQSEIYKDVRRYLLGLFTDCEVIQGYSNNVPHSQCAIYPDEHHPRNGNEHAD
nr:MAG TPA: tail completion protein [Caudoviricetes sp.]